MKSLHHKTKNRSGSTLVLVLALLSILLALALRERLAAQKFLQTENRLAVRAELNLAARDAVLGAISLLQNAVASGPEETSALLALPLQETLPNKIETTVTLADETSVLDVNLAGSVHAEKSQRFITNLLVALLTEGGVPDPDVKAAAITRRARQVQKESPAKTSKNTLPGRENGIYSSISPGELAEILAVKTLDEKRILNFINASPPPPGGETRTVNVNTADPFLIESLLGRENRQIADYLLKIREKRPITSLLILEGLENRVDTDILKAILSTESNLFSITAKAERDGQKMEIYAMIDINNKGDAQIARWSKH